jgi:hypothetical protein
MPDASCLIFGTEVHEMPDSALSLQPDACMPGGGALVAGGWWWLVLVLAC